MPQYPSFGTFFRISPSAYLLLNSDWLIIDANAACLRLAGCDARDILGRLVQEVLAENLQFSQAVVDDCLASVARALASGAADTLLVAARAAHAATAGNEGTVARKGRCWRMTHIPVADAEENAGSILLSIEDMTEVQEGVHKLLHGDPQGQAASLQSERLEAIGKLTGGIAHDFNNMLQIIGGNLQLLRRNLGADGAAQRRLESAASGVDMGARLASQLLAFAGKQPLRPQQMNLAEMLGRMDELSAAGVRRGTTVTLDLEQGLWPVYIDAGNLRDAIHRLTVNAEDAMGNGGVLSLSARNCLLDPVQLAAQPGVRAGKYVELCVIDQGEGMSQEVLDHAFEPFFTTRSSSGASGLGLSVVYGFVRQSGGFVVLESEKGAGTCVRVYLPADIAQAESSPPESGERGQGRSSAVVHAIEQAGPGLKILFVEDDPTLRMLTGEVMDELGHEVCLCESAEAALEQLGQRRFDVLLTDLGLAGMSGIELVRLARERDATLSVVIASGYEVDVRKEGLAGLRTMLKPYDIHQVRTLLENIRMERTGAGR